MIKREKLTAFYIEQFEADVSKSKSKNLRMKNPEERVGRLRHQMRTANPWRLGITTLEDFHHQTRNLYEVAFYKHKVSLLSSVRDELIPQLVRLDVETLMPQQKEGVDESFLAWLQEERPGAVCTRPLFLLYPGYKEEIIREQMTGMVPVRDPEGERSADHLHEGGRTGSGYH